MKAFLGCLIAPFAILAAFVVLVILGSLLFAGAVVVAVATNDVRFEVAATDPREAVQAVLGRAHIGPHAFEGIVHVDERRNGTSRVLVRIRQDETTTGDIREALQRSIESLEQSGELPPGAVRVSGSSSEAAGRPATLPSRRIVR